MIDKKQFSSPGFAKLDDFVIVQASGEDVSTFLQGQLTQDIHHCSTTQAQLAAWCTAKGRAFASCLVWQMQLEPSVYYLMLKKDIAEATVKRLRMFVLRAKVKFEILNLNLFGLWYERDNTTVHHLNSTAEINETYQWSVQINDGFCIISYPHTDNYQRQLLIINTAISSQTDNPLTSLPDLFNLLDATTANNVCKTLKLLVTPHKPEFFSYLDCQLWQAQDVLDGIAWIEKANQELFIPQDINFDAIGAINFKKGCYPGQEIVARSHYRGNLKRRMFIGLINNLSDDSLPGKDVFNNNGNEVCGQIVNQAVLDANSSTIILFECQLDSTESVTTLHLNDSQGPQITWQSVPYSVAKPSLFS